MLRKIAVTLAVIVMLLAAVLFYIFSQGPDLGKYEFLKQPRITALTAQRMLVVTAQGDPNAVGSKAFGLLFKRYFKIPGVPKSMHLAPRARWAGDMRVKSSWTGYYAGP
jgi:hypothetical protein